MRGCKKSVSQLTEKSERRLDTKSLLITLVYKAPFMIYETNEIPGSPLQCLRNVKYTLQTKRQIVDCKLQRFCVCREVQVKVSDNYSDLIILNGQPAMAHNCDNYHCFLK